MSGPSERLLATNDYSVWWEPVLQSENRYRLLEIIASEKSEVDLRALNSRKESLLHGVLSPNNGYDEDYLLLLVKLLLHKSIVNQQDDEFGKSPFHSAIELGYQSIVEAFLSSNRVNVKINLQDNDGNTPLHLAVVSPHYQILVPIILKQVGVDIFKINYRRENAFHLSMQLGRFELIDSFIEHIVRTSGRGSEDYAFYRLARKYYFTCSRSEWISIK
jgi:ankyrin repeat protein